MSDPETEALAQRLLAPIVNWRESPANASAPVEPIAPVETTSLVTPA